MPFIDPVRILPVGHQVIDQAHGDLVERINRLYEMWQTRQPAEQLALECSLLLRAFGRHFAEEEALVESLGFAAIDAHRQRHQDLLVDITAKVQRLCNKSDPYCETIVDVFSAIDQLLYEHEIVDDQEFWYLFQDATENTPLSGAILAIDEALSTGLFALDQQHYEVVLLVNRLGGLLAIEAPRAVIISVLNEILSQTIEHFAQEEELSAAHHLADHRAHIFMHRDLIVTLQEMIRRYEEGTFDGFEDDFRRYLKFWLIDHIVHVDTPMAQAVLGRLEP
jgi:hemerythrin